MTVKYSYYTKIPNYKLFKNAGGYRQFGYYQTDMSDFKQFARYALTSDSEIEFLFLHVRDGGTKTGLWKWTKGAGWLKIADE